MNAILSMMKQQTSATAEKLHDGLGILCPTTKQDPVAANPYSSSSRNNRGTSGSAGMPQSQQLTLVHLIPTGLNGHLPYKCHALLLGRSYSSTSGLFLLPGIISSDSRDEIKIMAWTPNPPWTIPCITQLIPLPILPDMQLIPSVCANRGTGGFRSTGTPQIYWSKFISIQ